MENQINPEIQEKPQGFFQSSTAKILMVGLLTLVLLIPLQYVKSLIFERSLRQKQVVEEINQKWGGSVYFYGPIVKVPYNTYEETNLVDSKTKQVTVQRTKYTDYAYFFPEDLKANLAIQVDPDGKKRSIFKSIVYTSNMDFKGSYKMPDFSSRKIPQEDIQWDKASIIVRTNNIKGIKGAVNIDLNGKKYALEPVANNTRDTVSTLETNALNIKEITSSGKAAFSMSVAHNGSEIVKIAPIGKQTQAVMTSNWHSPSFKGNFLPESKSITDKGFTANWNISYLNRPFSQNHFENLPDLGDYTFDTGFIMPVDQYQQSERAAKYGFLVIGLTFLVFFLIQTISKINIHIFQYTMIGLALIMFYTLLISITEHSSFLTGYLVAGASVVVMIGLYSRSIMKSVKFPVFITLSLTALYTFIYVIIQLEDYALLVGSIGLFLILGAVMYISRKIDWNGSQKIKA